MQETQVPDPKDPFEAHKAVRPENMTQPMGPLEEGDQALVDAANQLPEGSHKTLQEDGTSFQVFKHESPVQIHAITETHSPDKTITQSSTLINKTNTPGNNAISADTTEWPKGDHIGNMTAYVPDNEIGVDQPLSKLEQNHEKAQAAKLEIAGQMEEVHKHLGETGVEAAQR